MYRNVLHTSSLFEVHIRLVLQYQNVGSLLIAEPVTALYCVGSLKQSRNRVAIVEVRTVMKATPCINKMHYLPLFRSGLEIRPAVSEANCRERKAVV